ncbi:hypothetical protein O3W44_22610 [Pantoea sp. LMR881]|uniref:hypothetical protein n=1 Tax=Pantoea sp. LMR881 TaxID=3014336 RepID=UPI0022AFE3C7|nr:hypothetical protein [Pantoea sp. LMR881]MCZ4061213.1 hypothetical protein [Pantoea sp. LMR881]MCZ4061327.1 hypothetical protein [Pantoea sp. LMR881]
MSTQSKRVALPVDFVNIGVQSPAQNSSTTTSTIPMPVKLMGILFGTLGVMTLLNVVYTVAAGH